MRVGVWAGIGLVWTGVFAVAVAWLSYTLRESALAVVLDAASAGLVLSLAGPLLAGSGLALTRGRSGLKRTRTAGAVATAAALVVIPLLVHFGSFTYEAEEVRFTNAGTVLAGTVYLPNEDGPHPAVVLVHGSGPEARHAYAFYAKYLARRSIAALVYDKRGVGESTGDLYAADYGDYAGDALAAVRLLTGRADVDRNAVGLVGFSEGEWVAPLAASQSADVAFVAIIGASGLSPAAQVDTEIAIRLRASGYDDETVAKALAINEQLFDYQRTGEGGEELRAILAAVRGERWFSDAEDLPETVHPIDDYAWWRSVMDFDPLPVWERVRVPVLLLKGGADDRSAAEPMRTRISDALRRGGNLDVTVRIFPDADHMLLEWPLGEGTPPPVFTDGYLDALVEWVKRSAVNPAAGRPPD